MKVMVSPTDMSVIASNASAALEYLANSERYDALVRSGLSDAVRFCEVLETGEKIRASASSFFSAEGLAASQFLKFVFELPNGEELAARLDAVKSDVSLLSREAASRKKPTTRAKLASARLADYFFDFATKLAFYQAIHDRIRHHPPLD